ncbi:MAG: copper chaperone PCu(A)C [Pseudomonadota bacterium]
MKIITGIFASMFITCLNSAAFAELVVEDAYVRGLPPGVDNTSAYMTLRNTGDVALELTGASSPIAGSAMFHTTMNHDGMLHMQHVMSVNIPAHGEVVLESGGLHLMLTELKQNPVAGTTVTLTLQFADGSSHEISLPVRSVLDE